MVVLLVEEVEPSVVVAVVPVVPVVSVVSVVVVEVEAARVVPGVSLPFDENSRKRIRLPPPRATAVSIPVIHGWRSLDMWTRLYRRRGIASGSSANRVLWP